jgi:hypothetical protein
MNWDRDDIEPAGVYSFFLYWNGNVNFELGTVFSCIRVISAVKKVGFVSDTY